MAVTAKCKTCGKPFEKAVRYGVPVGTVNCPACRAGAKAAKTAEAEAKAGKARVEFRGPEGFVATCGGEVVGHHPTARAGAVAAAEAAGFEVTR